MTKKQLIEMIRRVIKEEISSLDTKKIITAINKIKKTEPEWGRLNPTFQDPIAEELYSMIKRYGIPDSWPESLWNKVENFLKKHNKI